MMGGSGPRLPDTWVQAEIAHQLLRAVEASDIANGCSHRERHHHVDARDRHQPLDALICERGAGEVALDHLQVLAETIELAKVPLDGKPLVLRHGLLDKPGTTLGSTQIGMWAGWDQVLVQDRLDDVLQPGALPHDLVATGDLPPQRLGRLVRDPDLWQEAASVELSEHAGVNGVSLDLRMGDDAHLLRVGDHHLRDMRREDSHNRGCVASRLDDHDVVLPEPLCKGREQFAPHVDASKPPKLAILPGHCLGKGAVDVQSDNAHASSLPSLARQTGAGGQHDTY